MRGLKREAGGVSLWVWPAAVSTCSRSHHYETMSERRPPSTLPTLGWAPCQSLRIHSLDRTFQKGWAGAHSHFVGKGEIQDLAPRGPQPWRPRSFLPGSGPGVDCSPVRTRLDPAPGMQGLGCPPSGSHPFVSWDQGFGVGRGAQAVSSSTENLTMKDQR